MSAAERIVKELLGENIDPRLAACCTERLTAMGMADKARLLRHCDNVKELHSYLREYVFHDDTKTAAFIQQCMLSLRGQTASV